MPDYAPRSIDALNQTHRAGMTTASLAHEPVFRQYTAGTTGDPANIPTCFCHVSRTFFRLCVSALLILTQNGQQGFFAPEEVAV